MINVYYNATLDNNVTLHHPNYYVYSAGHCWVLGVQAFHRVHLKLILVLTTASDPSSLLIQTSVCFNYRLLFEESFSFMLC
jgi:hypothetical protein